MREDITAEIARTTSEPPGIRVCKRAGVWPSGWTAGSQRFGWFGGTSYGMITAGEGRGEEERRGEERRGEERRGEEVQF
ncbi:unnamed protein product [Pleuronectes platessa]|uniref:Uncharacterized protein n=1 Tax=Pleuronectes platessa TaxID=8262 RepID=A0A9N7VGS6_PLEPL|nr:unnamed protein product [Pleuronectes platessa]